MIPLESLEIVFITSAFLLARSKSMIAIAPSASREFMMKVSKELSLRLIVALLIASELPSCWKVLVLKMRDPSSRKDLALEILPSIIESPEKKISLPCAAILPTMTELSKEMSASSYVAEIMLALGFLESNNLSESKTSS